MQNEILSKHPQADLDVYVVWFNMFPGDTRWRWDGDEMTDPRVVHYWDTQESVGTWFSANLTERGPPTWDFYALYAPDAHDLSAPTGFGGGAQGGGTIIGHHAQLAAAIAPLLQPKSSVASPFILRTSPGLLSRLIVKTQRTFGRVNAAPDDDLPSVTRVEMVRRTKGKVNVEGVVGYSVGLHRPHRAWTSSSEAT